MGSIPTWAKKGITFVAEWLLLCENKIIKDLLAFPTGLILRNFILWYLYFIMHRS